MLRRLLVVSLLLALPGISLGQGVAEKYISPSSLIYMRWDGFDSHRGAFDKTAAGQMLKGETGKFVYGLWDYINDQMEPLLAQVDPDIAAVAKELPGAISTLAKHGFSVSIDARKFHQNPPEIEATFIFPGNGGPKGKLAALVNKALQATRTEAKEVKVEGASLKRVSFPPAEVGFASVGDTAILIVGTVDPATVMARGAKQGDSIVNHPLYKEVNKFQEFHVWSRGFVDTAAIAKSVSAISPEAAKLSENLGLNGLKSVKFYSGFDGPAHRSVTEYHMPGARKGLLKLTKGKAFSLKDLPPLPHDITSFSVSSLDAPAMYDAFTDVAEGGVRAFSPDAADFVKEGIKQVERLLGVKVRDDLLSSLGDVMVTYSSPSESPFLNLGSVTAIKLKNEKKLIETVENMQKNFPPLPFVTLEVKKKSFRGVTTVEVQLGSGYDTQTFAIHNGWLIWANYPQPVHGYIMRAQGTLPTWKADALTEKALAPFPKEFTSFSWSDPRPGVQFTFTLLPPIMSALNGGAKLLPGTAPFDVHLIPHSLEVTRHLFPTITVTTDNGTVVRSDTRSALALPF